MQRHRAARYTPVAHDRLQAGGAARGVFAAALSVNAVALPQPRRLFLRIEMREAANGFSRYGADFFRPFRSLVDAVLLTENMAAPFFEADEVYIFLDECFVVEIFLDENIGHRQHHRHIGAGLDRYPLVGEHFGGHGVARIDDDDGYAALARHLDVVSELMAGPEVRDRRLEAPQDDHLGVHQKIGHVVGTFAVGPTGIAGHQMHRQPPRVHRAPTPAFHTRAPQAEQSLEPGVGGIGRDNGIGAVARHAVLHLAGDRIERFVPGDALNTIAG